MRGKNIERPLDRLYPVVMGISGIMAVAISIEFFYPADYAYLQWMGRGMDKEYRLTV